MRDSGAWRRAALCALVVAAALLAGCGGDPKAEIRERIEEARVAAEEGSLLALQDFVHSEYEDEAGRDKRGAIGLVMGLRRYAPDPRVFLLERSLEIEGEGVARARHYAALSSKPVASLEDLESVDADLVELELELVREGGKWRLRRASWEPVRIPGVL